MGLFKDLCVCISEINSIHQGTALIVMYGVGLYIYLLDMTYMAVGYNVTYMGNAKIAYISTVYDQSYGEKSHRSHCCKGTIAL